MTNEPANGERDSSQTSKPSARNCGFSPMQADWYESSIGTPQTIIEGLDDLSAALDAIRQTLT
ncbi:hypothetical protein [Microtetraspora malaysiensis]|uniref:hypothetical protein n=1 Tax=Microtetraspora malaysiensis TaxID=161358 RepID=UPI003D90CA73